MTIFEVADGEISTAEENSDNQTLQNEVAELESFAESIGQCLDVMNVDRVIATFESRAFGIRYSTTDEETFSGRGIEIDGRKNPSQIVEKLY